MEWNGDPVEFNSSAVYLCESSDIYFQMDKDMEGYNVTCLDDGSWDVPDVWPICLPCMFVRRTPMILIYFLFLQL